MWHRDSARLLSLSLTALVVASPGWSQQLQELPTAQVGEAAGEAGDDRGEYLRIRHDADGEPIALETSIVRFEPADDSGRGPIVDLIGAVHVADADYYAELERAFATYDALLYELVAPEGAQIPRNGKSAHPVGQVQQGLTSILDLSFQLERIDYAKENFVHADMTPDEFAKSMADRGESFLQLLLRMMGQAMAQQSAKGGSSDAKLLFALFAPDRSLRLKRLMAEQFEDLELAMNAIEGPHGSTLISQRNKKALDVLRSQIDAGKKRIGIFYGAGHMPDMARRLQEEFGMRASHVRWLTAWDLSGE